jgi:hypothetical protein
MADRTGFVKYQKMTWGDVAVDGLLTGMGVGVLMAVILLLLGLLDGKGLLATLAAFDPAGGGSAGVGGLMHLAVAGLYGVLSALLFHLALGRRPSLRRYGWALGIVFGLGMWLAAQAVFVPGLKLGLGMIPPWHFALAHAGYGAALGWLLARHQ